MGAIERYRQLARALLPALQQTDRQSYDSPDRSQTMHESSSPRALKPPKPTNGRPQNRPDHTRRMAHWGDVIRLFAVSYLWLFGVFLREQRGYPPLPR